MFDALGMPVSIRAHGAMCMPSRVTRILGATTYVVPTGYRLRLLSRTMQAIIAPINYRAGVQLFRDDALWFDSHGIDPPGLPEADTGEMQGNEIWHIATALSQPFHSIVPAGTRLRLALVATSADTSSHLWLSACFYGSLHAT